MRSAARADPQPMVKTSLILELRCSCNRKRYQALHTEDESEYARNTSSISAKARHARLAIGIVGRPGPAQVEQDCEMVRKV